jgi:hypothetical protein
MYLCSTACSAPSSDSLAAALQHDLLADRVIPASVVAGTLSATLNGFTYVVEFTHAPSGKSVMLSAAVAF